MDVDWKDIKQYTFTCQQFRKEDDGPWTTICSIWIGNNVIETWMKDLDNPLEGLLWGWHKFRTRMFNLMQQPLHVEFKVEGDGSVQLPLFRDSLFPHEP
jgi:hypothetical protein